MALEQGKISELIAPIVELGREVLGARIHPDDAKDQFNEKLLAAKAFVDEHESGWRNDFVTDMRSWLKDADHVFGAIAGTRPAERFKHRPGLDVLSRSVGKLDTLASSGEIDMA